MKNRSRGWEETPKSFKTPQGGECALGGCHNAQVSRFAPYCSSSHKQQAQNEREQSHLKNSKGWNWNSPSTVCAYCKGVLAPNDKEYCQACVSLGRDKPRRHGY